MLAEPQSSQYDWQFNLFGYSIRVAWSFWLAAFVLGYNWARFMDYFLQGTVMESPGMPVLLALWTAAVFLSILVHELGHSLAFSYYGYPSYIVLYHFGGLAVPNVYSSWNAARRRSLDGIPQIVISAAGPAAQLLLAAIVVAICIAAQVRCEILGFSFGGDAFPSSGIAYAFINALLFPSVCWALLNLAPVLPLDGGQIMHNVLRLTRVNQPQQVAHMISIAAAVMVAIYFMQSGRAMGGIMFLMFAATNYQALQGQRWY